MHFLKFLKHIEDRRNNSEIYLVSTAKDMPAKNSVISAAYQTIMLYLATGKDLSVVFCNL